MQTYIILVGATPTDPPAIKCLICERVSYHPKDISERYCGFCHRFHDDMAREVTREHGE
jgi:hypothetical protein